MKNGFLLADVKKRVIFLTAGILIVAFAVAANARESNIRLTPAEEAWLKAHPTIMVGTVPNWEPICMRNRTGDLSGMADSYKNLIERKFPVTFMLAPEVPWGKVLDDVRDKKVDMVMLLGQTADRDKYLLFTNVLVELPYVIITRDDAAAVKGMASLDGKRVSVRSRFVSHEWIADSYPEIVLFPKETTEEALEAVLAGEVDAYVGSLPEAGAAITKAGLTNLKVAANASFTNYLRIGVRNDWPELVSILNKGIADISTEEHNAIWNLWVHLHKEGIDKRVVYGLIGGFVFIIFAGTVIYVAHLHKSYSKIAQTEAELNRVNRMLTMLSQCNQMLVKGGGSEEILLQSVCLIILDTGGYALAQVVERTSTTPAGEVAPRITTARDPAAKPFLTPEMMADCLGNKALLNNETIIVRDIAQYSKKTLWSEAALKNGCNSVIALPLRFSERVDGALSIYAEDAGSFTEGEVELLKELADDLSLGVRMIRDKNKKEAAELMVRDSELKFRSLAQTAHDAIISINADGAVTFWNNGAMKIFGYANDEIAGRNVTLIIPERYHALHRAGLARVAAGGPPKVIGKTVTLEGVKKGGGEFPLEISLTMWEMGGEKYFTAFIRDISDRKKAEDALRESHENLQKVMENSPVPMALTDEEQHIIFLNRKFTETFGYDMGDIHTIGEWWPRAYPDPSYREKIKAEWNRHVNAVIHDGVEFVPMEARVCCKDGSHRDIVFNFSFISKRGLTMFHDITERKAMEDELVKSREMLANAQALAHLGNWDMDPQTGKGTWSDESFRIFGFEPGAFEPSFDKFMESVHPEDRKTMEGYLHKVLAEGLPRFEFDVRIIRPDGEERVIHDKLEVITGKDGKPVKITGVNFDITDRKLHERKLEIANQELKAALEQVRQTQAVLMRSEKLAAVGTLSAGVAHEILNPLNIISTICQLLLLDERRGRVHDSLNEIMLQIQRAAKITNSLRMFAREKKMDITAVDLGLLFDHTIGLMEHDLNLDNIFIERQYDPKTPLIMADSDQLAQVFMNLLTNARDVLQPRRNGMITVSTKSVENGIEFSFRDNGPGIPADMVNRIFDPFYTTKDPGKGTGLGLSVVYRIIEDHRGTITVESREGEGTSFTIFLPMTINGGAMVRMKKTETT